MRTASSTLPAGARTPATAKSIWSFIGWIKDEINAAQGQSELRLPRVDAEIFAAKGPDGIPVYEYEDWSFHLDQEEITALLMGESLYGQRGLAIRELAQNALDALELRNLLQLRFRKRLQKESSSATTDGTP